MPFYGHSWAGCNVETDGKKVQANGAYQQCAAGWEKPGLNEIGPVTVAKAEPIKEPIVERKAKTITFPKDSVSIGLAETKARLEKERWRRHLPKSIIILTVRNRSFRKRKMNLNM